VAPQPILPVKPGVICGELSRQSSLHLVDQPIRNANPTDAGGDRTGKSRWLPVLPSWIGNQQFNFVLVRSMRGAKNLYLYEIPAGRPDVRYPHPDDSVS